MSDTAHGLKAENADRGRRRFATKVPNVLDVPLDQIRGDDPPADGTAKARLAVAAFNASL